MNTKEPSPGRSGHKDNPSRFFCKGIRRKNKGTQNRQPCHSFFGMTELLSYLQTYRLGVQGKATEKLAQASKRSKASGRTGLAQKLQPEPAERIIKISRRQRSAACS